MTRPAYYNELDKDAAAWLRVLISRNLIAPGDVDERSILEVKPDDLRGYGQCHFFAGIGGWSLALRLAGIPDDRPVWSGSCPCQPFSAAGKQRGSDDERHLWPAFFSLIRECRPGTVVGEQVAGAAGFAWYDHVAADLESAGYAAAAANLGAHSVGAPHLRQRLYWVAHCNEGRHTPVQPERIEGLGRGKDRQWSQPGPKHGESACCVANADSSAAELLRGNAGRARTCEREVPAGRGESCDLADPAPGGQRVHGSASWDAGHAAQRDDACSLADPAVPCDRRQGNAADHGGAQAIGPADRAGGCGCAFGLLGNAGNEGLQEQRRFPGVSRGASGSGAGQAVERADAHVAWADLEWLQCSDGKARPTQRGLFPLASRLPEGLVRGGDRGMALDADQSAEARVMRLRGYGNAIVPPLAAAFVMAAMEPA